MPDEHNGSASPGRPRDADIDARILDAARSIFARDGYAAVSVSAVARLAGLPRSTVYRRYPSVVAMRYAAAFVPAAGLTPPEETGDLRTDMAAHITANASAFRDPASLRLLRALMADVLVDPEARAAVNDTYIKPRLAQIAEVLERARVRGDLPATVDPDLAAKAVTGTLVYHAVLLDQDVDDTMIQALLDLLFPRSSAAKRRR